MSNKPEPFSYNATIVKIIDGDTVDALIDVGFSIMTKKRIRFLGSIHPNPEHVIRKKRLEDWQLKTGLLNYCLKMTISLY